MPASVLLITVAEDRFAGSAVQFEDLAAEFRRRGIAATVLYRYDASDPYSIDLKAQTPTGSADRVVLDYSSDPATLRSFVSRGSFDVIICHLNAMPPLIAGLNDLKTPIVAYSGISGPIGADVQESLRDDRTRAAVVVSRTAYSELARMAPPELLARTHVIPQSTVVAESPQEYQRARTALGTSRPLAVAVASLRPYKRIDLFIEAVLAVRTRVRDVRGLVVGKRTVSQVAFLARQFRLKERASRDVGVLEFDEALFVDATPYPASWMRHANAAVCSSDDYEAIPGALREAASLGLPIAATDVGSIREWANGNPGYDVTMVEPRSVESLTRGITRALSARSADPQNRRPGAARRRREQSTRRAEGYLLVLREVLGAG